MSGRGGGKTEFRIQNERSIRVAYELIPMYTPIPKGRQLNVNYKSWIAPREYDALNEKGG